MLVENVLFKDKSNHKLQIRAKYRYFQTYMKRKKGPKELYRNTVQKAES